MNPSTEEVHSIDKRLSLVEADLQSMAGTRRIILGMAAFLFVQGIGGVVAFTEMQSQLKGLSLAEFQVSTAAILTMLSDQAGEVSGIRNEDARLRASADSLGQQILDIRKMIEERTEERFYRTDGDRLEARINRLEDLQIINRPDQ